MFKNAKHIVSTGTCLKRLISSKTSPPDASVHLVFQGTSEGNPTIAHKLWATACTSGSSKPLDSRLLFRDNSILSIVNLGDSLSWEKMTSDKRRETVRKAVGSAVGKIKDVATSSGVRSIRFEVSGDKVDAQAAAVGARLGLHSFTLKTDPSSNPGKGK